jgi:hypothetical protein
LQRKVVYAGANTGSFAQGSADLAEYMDLEVDPKQIERVTERIGAERCAGRDAEVALYMALPLTQRKDKPADIPAPALAVVGVDGGRLQIRRDAAASPAGAEAAEALPPDDKHGGTHWREDKIGVLMTMQSEEKASDPCPQVPSAFVDPTRIMKLARELKTKKSAGVESGQHESAQETDTPEVGILPGSAAGVRGRRLGQCLDGVAESFFVVHADLGHHSRHQLPIRVGAGGPALRGGLAVLCALGDMGLARGSGASHRRVGTAAGGVGFTARE